MLLGVKKCFFQIFITQGFNISIQSLRDLDFSKSSFFFRLPFRKSWILQVYWKQQVKSVHEHYFSLYTFSCTRVKVLRSLSTRFKYLAKSFKVYLVSRWDILTLWYYEVVFNDNQIINYPLLLTMVTVLYIYKLYLTDAH